MSWLACPIISDFIISNSKGVGCTPSIRRKIMLLISRTVWRVESWDTLLKNKTKQKKKTAQRKRNTQRERGKHGTTRASVYSREQDRHLHCMCLLCTFCNIRGVLIRTFLACFRASWFDDGGGKADGMNVHILIIIVLSQCQSKYSVPKNFYSRTHISSQC